MPEQRNVILAIALSFAVLLTWTYFFPPKPTHRAPQQAAQAHAVAPVTNGTPAGKMIARDTALAASARVPIGGTGMRVKGSLSLIGARIDDLLLTDYGETTKRGSPRITLLSPRGTAEAYYAEFGWLPQTGANIVVPGADTIWALEHGAQLTPTTPVTLRWDNPQGIIFRLTLAIDANYMITVTQEVVNPTAVALQLAPYGDIVRQNIVRKTQILSQGDRFMGYLGDDLRLKAWHDVVKAEPLSFSSAGGWMGLSEKYWLTAIAPPQNETFNVTTQGADLPGGRGITALYALSSRATAPGQTSRTVLHFFAGAAEAKVLQDYRDTLGIKKLDLAVDWGKISWILTKPLFFVLHSIYAVVGNFGVAILIATLLLKLVFFPLTNSSFVAMAKMKKLQPQVKELQDKLKDDRVELQKQMMALYQKEKVNPLAGCLPILLQMPVFWSFWKVMNTTIEMRHAPFFGWVQDLSSRDPTSLLNLFGALPWHIPDFQAMFGPVPIVGPALAGILGALSIGAWPLIMGTTMVVQSRLNPPPTDPSQRIVFAMMPLIFTVMLSSFSVGIVIYYTWNNLLSMTQQYIIMRRLGTPIDLAQVLGFKALARLFSGARASTPHEGKG